MSVLSKVALTALGAITSGVVAYNFMASRIRYNIIESTKYYVIKDKICDDSIINYEMKQYNVKTIPNFDKDSLNTKIKYMYWVTKSSFESLENAYNESLYGNHITKKVIDTILKEYIESTPDKKIKERYVMINFTNYKALIDIVDNNTNNNCLQFNIYADVNMIIKS